MEGNEMCGNHIRSIFCAAVSRFCHPLPKEKAPANAAQQIQANSTPQ
jgi:hypothetical protein